MDIKTIIAGLVALAVLIVVGFAASRVVNVADQQPTQTLGSLSGPDIPSEYLHWGAGAGTYIYAPRLAMAQATNTPCSIQAPLNGTSTLITAAANISVASTSILEIAKSNTPYASTTLIGNTYPVTAGLTEVIVASTTRGNPVGGGIDQETFGPGQWLVFKFGGAPTSLNGPVGFCSAQWNVI